MPIPRHARLTIRMSKQGVAALDRVAARRGVSRADCLEQLVRNADADPEGYYLRKAAMNSFMAAMVSAAVAKEVLGDKARSVLSTVMADGESLMGPLPAPPPEVLAQAETDERLRWLLEAYGMNLAS